MRCERWTVTVLTRSAAAGTAPAQQLQRLIGAIDASAAGGEDERDVHLTHTNTVIDEHDGGILFINRDGPSPPAAPAPTRPNPRLAVGRQGLPVPPRPPAPTVPDDGNEEPAAEDSDSGADDVRPASRAGPLPAASPARGRPPAIEVSVGQRVLCGVAFGWVRGATTPCRLAHSIVWATAVFPCVGLQRLTCQWTADRVGVWLLVTAAATACNVAVVFGWCAVQARGAQAAAAGAPREAHSKSEERPGDSSGPSVDVDVIARNRACTLAAE
jgi:hypothetical protein